MNVLHSLQVWRRVCGSFGVAVSFGLAGSRIGFSGTTSSTVPSAAILEVLAVLGASVALPGLCIARFPGTGVEFVQLAR